MTSGNPMRTAIHLNQSNELWFMGAHQNTGDTLNYVSSTTITDGQPYSFNINDVTTAR